jgi:hypothetical protein
MHNLSLSNLIISLEKSIDILSEPDVSKAGAVQTGKEPGFCPVFSAE